jgi:hypothetical protein
MGSATDRQETIEHGTRVIITSGENQGRFGVVADRRWASDEDAFKAASGDPNVSRFAEVESYVVLTRDSRREYVDVDPDELTVTTGANWGRITTPQQQQEMEERDRERQLERRNVPEDAVGIDAGEPGAVPGTSPDDEEDPNPRSRELPTEVEGTSDEGSVEPPFDPGEHTVEAVKERMTELSDEEKQAVIEAEKEGQNRTGITGES